MDCDRASSKKLISPRTLIKSLRRCQDLIFIILVIAFFATTVAVFYRPLSENLISFPNGDAFGHVWFLWAKRYNHFHGLPSNFTAFVGYPFGAKLGGPFINSPLFHGLSLLLIRLFNEVFVFNLLNILSYALSLITAYILLKHITGSFLASVFGSLLFAFCPYHLIRSMGHLYLAQIEVWPLFFLGLFLLVEKNSLRFSLIASAMAVLPFLTDYYYGYFSALAVALFIAFALVSRKAFKGSLYQELKLSNLAAFSASWLVLAVSSSLPALGYLAKEGISSAARPLEDLYQYTAYGWEYFLPIPYNPFVQRLERIGLIPRIPIEEYGLWIYVGTITLLMASVCLFTLKSTIRKKEDLLKRRIISFVPFLVLAIAAFYLISLKPTLTFAGLRIAFPTYYLFKLFPMFRVYARVVVIIMVGLSTLAALGLDFVSLRLKSTASRVLAASLVIALSAIDFAYKPWRSTIDATARGMPPVHQLLLETKTNENYCVLLVSIEEGRTGLSLPLPYWYVFYQRNHKVPLMNPDKADPKEAEFASLVEDLGSEKGLRLAGLSGAKHLLVSYDDDPRSAELREALKARKGLKFIGSFGNMDLFKISYFVSLPDLFLPERVAYLEGGFEALAFLLESWQDPQTTAFYLSKFATPEQNRAIKRLASDVIDPKRGLFVRPTENHLDKPEKFIWRKLSESHYQLSVETKGPFFFVLNRPYKFGWVLSSDTTALDYEVFPYNGYGCLIYLRTIGSYAAHLQLDFRYEPGQQAWQVHRNLDRA